MHGGLNPYTNSNAISHSQRLGYHQRYIDIADADLLAAADKTESLLEQQLSIVPPNS